MLMIATLLAGGITFAQVKSSAPTEQTAAKPVKAERSRHARHKAMIRHAKYHKTKRAKNMRHKKVAQMKRHLHKKMATHQG